LFHFRYITQKLKMTLNLMNCKMNHRGIQKFNFRFQISSLQKQKKGTKDLKLGILFHFAPKFSHQPYQSLRTRFTPHP
jgi:hypothetical protein